MNVLRFRLEQHIGTTAKEAANYYATELTRNDAIPQQIRKVFGINTEPYNIPLTPNEAEMQKLNELAQRTFFTQTEAQQTFQRELEQMMRQRPGVVGLETSASEVTFLEEIAQTLGGANQGPTNIDRLRNLHYYMKGQAMAELQIYPEFGTAIETAVDRDLGLSREF